MLFHEQNEQTNFRRTLPPHDRGPLHHVLLLHLPRRWPSWICVAACLVFCNNCTSNVLDLNIYIYQHQDKKVNIETFKIHVEAKNNGLFCCASSHTA